MSARDFSTLFAALAQKAHEIDEVVERPPEEVRFIDEEHKAQAAFIRDPSRFKVLLCTRRAGKSYGIALEFLLDAWLNPYANYLYVGLTRTAAKKAIWKDGLKEIDRRLNLGLRFNETELTCTLPNKAVIYVLGMDADERQKERARGGKYRKVCVDEAQSFGADLTSIIVEVLRPTVADAQGTIIIAGTPGIVRQGLFFELSHDQDPQTPGTWERPEMQTAAKWSGHRWNAGVNPHMTKQWEREIADMKAVNPRIAETPRFQREYLGRWTVDDDNLVYKYRPVRNDFNGNLPEYEYGSWHYLLGVDLGYEDATAFTVGAYHDNDDKLYVVEAFQHTKLDITAVAGHVHELMERYEFDEMVIDGANKQAVEELKRRHQIPFAAADKTGKSDFIEIMNGDFIQAKIRIDPSRCMALIEEYAGLVWDEKSLKREEHPGCPNHQADSLLYLWRKAYAYLSERYKPPVKPGTAEWHDQRLAELEERACEEIAAARREREEEEGLLWT